MLTSETWCSSCKPTSAESYIYDPYDDGIPESKLYQTIYRQRKSLQPNVKRWHHSIEAARANQDNPVPSLQNRIGHYRNGGGAGAGRGITMTPRLASSLQARDPLVRASRKPAERRMLRATQYPGDIAHSRKRTSSKALGALHPNARDHRAKTPIEDIVHSREIPFWRIQNLNVSAQSIRTEQFSDRRISEQNCRRQCMDGICNDVHCMAGSARADSTPDRRIQVST